MVFAVVSGGICSGIWIVHDLRKIGTGKSSALLSKSELKHK